MLCLNKQVLLLSSSMLCLNKQSMSSSMLWRLRQSTPFNGIVRLYQLSMRLVRQGVCKEMASC